MKAIKLLFLAGFLFAGGFAGIAQNVLENISIESFTKLEEDKSRVILDVRTEQEYKAGHIPGAININYYDDNAGDRMKNLDKNSSVYVYCQAGGRAKKACDFLLESGFKKVYHIEGDMMGWEKSGLPVNKTEVE